MSEYYEKVNYEGVQYATRGEQCIWVETKIPGLTADQLHAALELLKETYELGYAAGVEFRMGAK